MFGSLKKKLQEAVEKVSKSIKDEPKPQEMPAYVEEPRVRTDTEKPKEGLPEPELSADEMHEQQKMEKPKETAEAIETPIKHTARAASETKTEPEESRAAAQSLDKIIEETKPDFESQIQKKIEELEDLRDKVAEEEIDIDERRRNKDGPFTIMMVGFNGTGKTTTLAKLAHRLKEYNPILAAADTFRAASIEQLEEHGKRLGLRVVKHTYGADSAAVIFDAKKHAAAAGSRLVLADTAGRSHSNVNLMDELKKVARVNNPDLKILVLDSVTGNDIYDQCNLFNEAVGVDAIILTKADVYEKGGAALSAAYTLKKPILYIGTGQNYDDLKEFKPEEIVKNLLG